MLLSLAHKTVLAHNRCSIHLLGECMNDSSLVQLRTSMCMCVLSHSVMSNSLWSNGLWPPGSSVHGILQARILELVAISFSRGSFQPRDQTCISYIERWIFFYHCTTWEAQVVFITVLSSTSHKSGTILSLVFEFSLVIYNLYSYYHLPRSRFHFSSLLY